MILLLPHLNLNLNPNLNPNLHPPGEITITIKIMIKRRNKMLREKATA